MSILRLSIRQDLLIHTISDPIALRWDESMDVEFGTDYSNLGIDFAAKGDSRFPHFAKIDLADGESFSSGTTLISDCFIGGYEDDGNNSNNGVVDGAKLQLTADRPKSVFPGHKSIPHQASRLQVNPEIARTSSSHVSLASHASTEPFPTTMFTMAIDCNDVIDVVTQSPPIDVTKQVEDEGIHVFTKGGDDDDADTRCTKRSNLSAISCNSSASDSNVFISKRQDSQPDSTRCKNDTIQEQGTFRDYYYNHCILISRRRLDSNTKVSERRY